MTTLLNRTERHLMECGRVDDCAGFDLDVDLILSDVCVLSRHRSERAGFTPDTLDCFCDSVSAHEFGEAMLRKHRARYGVDLIRESKGEVLGLLPFSKFSIPDTPIYFDRTLYVAVFPMGPAPARFFGIIDLSDVFLNSFVEDPASHKCYTNFSCVSFGKCLEVVA